MGRKKSNKVAGENVPVGENLSPRETKVALALTTSKNLSPQEKVKAALEYRLGEMQAITATPQVVRAVKAGLVRRLVAEAAPRSLGLLMRVVEKGHDALDAGDNASQIHLDAAKHLTNLTGLQAIAEEKDIGELSDLELKQMLEQASAEATRRSSIEAEGTVSAPDDAPVQGQVPDNTDILFS